jgi:hypothetical protein
MNNKFLYACGCVLLAGALTSCGGNAKKTEAASDEVATMPEYKVLDNPQVDLSAYPVDKDGYIVLFDGKEMKGWRGYGKDYIPSKWTVEDGCIKFNGTGGGEAQEGDGGDLIFAHKFKNFELELEWKISKGGNSGILYLAQEVESKDPATGEWRLEPIYISAPEAQVLDNENHPDAKLGKDNNRQSMSLYDMIPAKPQNAKPFGEWNKAKVMVFKGTVVHGQNDENVVEYHLWTQKWTDMLQASKFSKEDWPLAFELLNNVGGANHEGYIAFQDHGDDVWFRNIRIKILD